MKYIIVTNNVKEIPEKYIIDKFIIVTMEEFIELNNLTNNALLNESLVIDHKYVNADFINNLDNNNILVYNEDKKLVINSDNEKEPIIYIFKTEQEYLDYKDNLEDIVKIPDDTFYICTYLKQFYDDFVNNIEINSELAPSYKNYQDIHKIIFMSYYFKSHHLVPIDKLVIFNNNTAPNIESDNIQIISIPDCESEEAINYIESCKEDLIARLDAIEKAGVPSIDSIVFNEYDNKLILIPDYIDLDEGDNRDTFITNIRLLKRIGVRCNYIVLDPLK